MSKFSVSSYGPAAGFLVALAFAAGACAEKPQAAEPAPSAVRPASPSGLPRIEKLIGAAACGSDSDCRVIGVGARACGGPEAYRAWSVVGTDASLLQETVARDATARREELERSGMMSTCAIQPVPAVSCVRTNANAGPGRCTLESRGQRNQ